MRCHRALSISLSIIVVATTGRMSFADTETPSSAQETAVTKPIAEQPSAKPAPTEAKPSAKPTTTSACPRCSERPPVYVADWARLAALTQSD
jgi:hypothetical protein